MTNTTIDIIGNWLLAALTAFLGVECLYFTNRYYIMQATTTVLYFGIPYALFMFFGSVMFVWAAIKSLRGSSN